MNQEFHLIPDHQFVQTTAIHYQTSVLIIISSQSLVTLSLLQNVFPGIPVQCSVSPLCYFLFKTFIPILPLIFLKQLLICGIFYVHPLNMTNSLKTGIFELMVQYGNNRPIMYFLYIYSRFIQNERFNSI